MKVVLKDTVLSKIAKAKREAEMQHRKVDYVLLTPEEFLDAEREVIPLYATYDSAKPLAQQLVARDFEKRVKDTGWARPRYRAILAGQIMGCDIYVVPEEFHPA